MKDDKSDIKKDRSQDFPINPKTFGEIILENEELHKKRTTPPTAREISRICK